jgi:SET domain-containing protein
MLLVKTTLEKDEYGGIGLFSAQYIKKNNIVWQYDPRFTLTITKKDMESFSPLYKIWVDKYAYNFCDAESDDVFLDIDDSRFMNHSNEATTYYDAESRAYRAAIDIKVGTELTIDYRDFCEEINF